MRRLPAVLVVAQVACGGLPSDRQPDFSRSTPIEDLDQSTCGDRVTASSPSPQVEVSSVEGAAVSATARDVPFRSGQEVCGFSIESDDTLHVLLQPCELHPDEVVKSDCLYKFEFTVDAASADGLSLWRREDEFAGDTEPMKIAETHIGWRF